MTISRLKHIKNAHRLISRIQTRAKWTRYSWCLDRFVIWLTQSDMVDMGYNYPLPHLFPQSLIHNCSNSFWVSSTAIGASQCPPMLDRLFGPSLVRTGWRDEESMGFVCMYVYIYICICNGWVVHCHTHAWDVWLPSEMCVCLDFYPTSHRTKAIIISNPCRSYPSNTRYCCVRTGL